MLPTGGPIQWAVKEAERVRKAGLRSVIIPSCQPKVPYWDPYYQPLWAALQDHEMIMAFHNAATEEPVRQDLPLLPLVTDLKMVGQIRTLAGILSSGVPGAYPKLKFVVVEGGIGWVAAAVRLLDHLWEDHRGWIEPHLDEPPSFYCKRQFYFTFEDDKAGLLTRSLLNVDHLMWGSDYPHTEGTFPRSREQIARDFAELPEGETHKIVIDNAAQLYGL
jgi:predicted TIM-barrel fold metal-dependent hydrolase